MTPEERALRDAWMREMWAPVHEVPRWVREEQRKSARAALRTMEEMALEAVHSASTDGPDLRTPLSTGCAENGGPESPEGHAECA